MAKKKSSAAGAANGNGNGNSAVASGNGNGLPSEAPPPGSHAVGEEQEMRDRKAEQLKTLNSILIKEAANRRGQVEALTSRLDELSADDAALAAAERAVAQAALAAPLRAAADEVSALRSRVAAVQESLWAAESRAALEASAKDKAVARLETTVGEQARLLKLLRAKEAEVASVSHRVSGLETMVAELEGNNSELFGEKGELAKQLKEMKEAVRMVSDQKAAVERSLHEFKNTAHAHRTGMENKVKAMVEELKVLGDKKVEMDTRAVSLEADLKAAVAKREELEADVAAKKKELDMVKGENSRFQSDVITAEKKHTSSAAEVERLSKELDELVKKKEVAAMSFDAEKAAIMREMGLLKTSLEVMQANKDSAEETVCEKDAEAAKLRTELKDLHVSMSQLQSSCNELDTKLSLLNDEKNSVQEALDDEKAEACKLKSRIEALEKCNGKKDGQIGTMKVTLEEKKVKINVLSKDIELLNLAVVEAQRKRKGGIWAWVYAATTTMVAAISFIYATRSK
ncbi:hypothetical protein GUJ93_ZPchr0012g19939 [Zizania palustris]|uniref:Uncharacterized protein n=1 Tax=Zizania palustris TaxID=103762 RepID=A0A8J5WK66_ZIZPA|nr:hypothetical protein GUJ93_ZPchr0012g19939 [Zizania palustris]